MTTVAMKNGAVGCVCDSNIRDATKIIDLGFPVYYTGIKPVDSKGRGIVKAFDVPVQCESEPEIWSLPILTASSSFHPKSRPKSFGSRWRR